MVKLTALFYLMLFSCISNAQTAADSLKRAHKKARALAWHPGKNIFTVSPLQFLNNGNISWETHEGFGFAYERIFMNGYLGLSVPVYFKKKNAGFYSMPALKFYPTNQGVAKLALGPQLLIAHLEDEFITEVNYRPNSAPLNTIKDVFRTQIGIGLNCSFTATISEHFVIGFDGVAGKILQDSFNENSDANNLAPGKILFLSVGINAGFRF